MSINNFDRKPCAKAKSNKEFNTIKHIGNGGCGNYNCLDCYAGGKKKPKSDKYKSKRKGRA